jgi:hypothetical protein
MKPPFSGFARPATMVPAACYLYFLARYHSAAYAACGALVLGGFYLRFAFWDRKALPGLAFAAVTLTGLGLPVLGLWQYFEARDLGDLDMSAYVCALWNLRHGFFHYAFHGVNLFGVHSQYTAFLWIPVHAPTGETGLKIGKALCLLAAVLLLVRRYRGGKADERHKEGAAWAATAALLSPPIASQFFFGFHPEFLAAPVLVLAMTAYREARLGYFLLCAAFLTWTKEPLTLAVGGLLLLAWIEKRSWTWILLPGLLCCAQIAVYWFLILPHFAPQGNLLGGFMPSSPADVLRAWFRPNTALYLAHIYLPFLPLALAMPKRYLILPLPLMIFYAAFPDTLFTVLWPNYGFPLAILCAGSLALQDGAREDRAPGNAVPETAARPARLPDGRILMACAVTSLLCYPLWREVLTFPRGDVARARELADLRARIPDSASLLINAPNVARFAARREIGLWGGSSTWGKRVKPPEAYDYVVVDAKFHPYWLVDAEDLRAGLAALATSPAWTREYGRDSLYLFRRNPVSSQADRSGAGP